VLGKLRIDEKDIFEAVSMVHKRCRGGYAAVAMIPGFGVIAFRDPNGIRPICLGRRETLLGEEWMVASESVAMHAVGYERVRDLEPGEAVLLTVDGRLFTQQCAEDPVHSPCIFEYVYFARPDSVIDDIFVHKARQRMGKKLAKKIKRDWPGHDIDAVVPIPDTSRTAALALANSLGVTYSEGFIKNRYIGRTFIMPGQQVRKKSVRQKLNAIDLEFKGKNVLLVDDSIVRGTTSRQIVQMARESGAKKVYFASAAPPVRYPHVYGINMPTRSELVAAGRTIPEITQEIGADYLIYQEVDDMKAAIVEGTDITELDMSCFTGEYCTGTIDESYLEWLEDNQSS